MTTLKLENAKYSDYKAYLKEPSRPPSKGGNTRALHQHVLTIGSETYSFLALGAQKWAFKEDSISFEYEAKDVGGKQYKNVITSTFVAMDGKGNVIVRGNRSSKPTLRTAPARMPGSRREQRD